MGKETLEKLKFCRKKCKELGLAQQPQTLTIFSFLVIKFYQMQAKAIKGIKKRAATPQYIALTSLLCWVLRTPFEQKLTT